MNHNPRTEPCRETECRPRYEDLETDKGTLTACTEYVHDLRKRLTDKEIQLTASQKEYQEAHQALSQARAKLAQQQEQITGCQARVQNLADQVTLTQASTTLMIVKLAEGFDRHMAEVHTDVSTISSLFSLPPEGHSPAEDRNTESGQQREIDYTGEPNAAGINKELVMPTDKTWQGLLEDPADATKTKPMLGATATKVIDVRIVQQAPEPIKRLRRRKAKSSAARVPHIISILRKTHITEPEPPTAEVQENGRAGSPDKPLTARQLIEQWEDEATDWKEFVAQPPKEFAAPRTTPVSSSQNNIDPSNDVIVKDDETQETYVELKSII